MILHVLFFIVGLLFLLKGADFLVGGAASLARRFHISSIVIGLTIVSFGTSAPELVVNIFSALRGNTDLALGNILGSNIANILLILGVAACLYPISVQKNTTWKEIPFSLLAVLVLSIVGNDALIDRGSYSGLTRSDGLILLAFFIIFMYYIFGIAQEKEHSEISVGTSVSVVRAIFLFCVGLIGLALGGVWAVDGAVGMARVLGLSEALIGLTIVAIGTSLPELATSIVAARKKEVDIAVGNIVGSNIFNIFWILGLTAVIRPIPMTAQLQIDVVVTLGVTLALFLMLFVGKRHLLERWQGVSFVAMYIGYIVYLVQRG